MPRLILLLSVIVSVLIVVGSYFSSKKIKMYEGNDMEGKIVSDENNIKTTTPSSNIFSAAPNTDAVPKNIKVESVDENTNEVQILEEKEIPLAQEKLFEVSPSKTQDEPKQEVRDTATREEEHPPRGLPPEINKRVFELEKELMSGNVTPERAMEIIELMNELLRPVRAEHVYTEPPTSDGGALQIEPPP